MSTLAQTATESTRSLRSSRFDRPMAFDFYAEPDYVNSIRGAAFDEQVEFTASTFSETWDLAKKHGRILSERWGVHGIYVFRNLGPCQEAWPDS
jgi:hypothetical protein